LATAILEILALHQMLGRMGIEVSSYHEIEIDEDGDCTITVEAQLPPVLHEVKIDFEI
jgi:hypothetical protein